MISAASWEASKENRQWTQELNCYTLWFVKQLSNFKCLRYDRDKIECSGIFNSQSEFQTTLKEALIVSRGRGSQSSHNFQEF